jgi:hypothetical protein
MPIRAVSMLDSLAAECVILAPIAPDAADLSHLTTDSRRGWAAILPVVEPASGRRRTRHLDSRAPEPEARHQGLSA